MTRRAQACQEPGARGRTCQSSRLRWGVSAVGQQAESRIDVGLSHQRLGLLAELQVPGEAAANAKGQVATQFDQFDVDHTGRQVDAVGR